MSNKRLRVVLLTHGGTEKALEYLLALDCVTVAGVFVETHTNRQYSLKEKVKRSVRYDGYAATLAKLARTPFNRNKPARDEGAMLDSRERLRTIAEQKGVPIHFLANYHSDDSIALMRAAEADLGVVLGTNILKESVFKIPRLGCINLHQGLAPYYRGGPPVFWELFNGENEVGITVHFVEAKVDTGEIVLQTTVPLAYDYSYGLGFESFIADYRRKLTEPCARLAAEAVRMIAEGSATPRPQDTSLGKRYRLPLKKEKDELRRRLRERRVSGQLSVREASARD